jgi:hypothetical protein
MRALLKDVPHVLANPYENVLDEEIAKAVAQANGLFRRPPRVFARDTSEWGYHVGPSGGGAVEMLDAYRALPNERRELLEIAQSGATTSMMKTDAAVIRTPLLPLTLAVQHHIDEQRERFPDYGRGLSAKDVIDRVGGKAAFPGYQVQEGLAAERMKDLGQKSTRNDIFDEYLAFHAPYAAVTALDKGTIHRAKMAKLPSLPRMTADLREVLHILDRVISGEFDLVESAG